MAALHLHHDLTRSRVGHDEEMRSARTGGDIPTVDRGAITTRIVRGSGHEYDRRRMDPERGAVHELEAVVGHFE